MKISTNLNNSEYCGTSMPTKSTRTNLIMANEPDRQHGNKFNSLQAAASNHDHFWPNSPRGGVEAEKCGVSKTTFIREQPRDHQRPTRVKKQPRQGEKVMQRSDLVTPPYHIGYIVAA
ncbi:hypothetical protein A2U01_0000392 [Trifolium medium]|uniref:Uncharacterized protein n=1 Tax=Trifolium medium TaxID=97028 RepID=A0A392LXG3_9FABA|nr:hypothetical protein [Trifolium medium]